MYHRFLCRMGPALRYLALLLLFSSLLSTAAVARDTSVIARFDAHVVRVKDGDSIIVERVTTKRRSEIRLAGIDAPELGQPWGIQSRAALKRLIEGKRIRVEVTDRDVYHRLVGKLWLGRIYVNAHMTRSGHAWAFDRYMRDADIRAGQIAARKEKRGIWSLPARDRLPPATWRQQNPR